MRRKSAGMILLLLAITAIVVSACGANSGNTAQGDAINDTRSLVAGAEGFFERGETAAEVVAKAEAAGLDYRVLEVSNFVGGTSNKVTVSLESGQPWAAYLFLPSAAGEQGTMVMLDREGDIAGPILGWPCDTVKIFLKQAAITDFTNEFCS
ncbi:MAG: hypothetical protein HQ478_10250 [Chloroflexi bacterium]|nr:hypothetical protein [Chloroflexota bacterium]